MLTVNHNAGGDCREVIMGILTVAESLVDKITAQDITNAISKHLACDWGDVGPKRWLANDWAVGHKEQIISTFSSSNGIKFHVITDRNRRATRIIPA